MNEESYTKPTKKVPDQIFDIPEVTTQEPKEPPIEKSDFEKKMENPFACSICREAFAEPRDLENHVEMHLRKSTPVAPGVLGETEVDPKPDSPPVAPSALGTTEVDPKTDLPTVAPGVMGTIEVDPKVDLLEIFEPPTQVATLGLAPGGEVETDLPTVAPGVMGTTEVDPKVDSPEILEPPTQVATLGLALAVR